MSKQKLILSAIVFAVILVTIGETDFKKHVTKLIDSEAIYTVCFGTYLQKIFKQLRQENFPGFILSAQTATWYPVRSMPEANGVYIGSPITLLRL